MLCSHCGAHLMDDETVCSRCGARRAPEVPVGKDGKPLPTREERKNKKDRRDHIFAKIILPIVGSTLSIIAFCVLVWMGYGYLKDYSNGLNGAGETQVISENGLFYAADIENNLNAAYIKADKENTANYPGVSQFALQDTTNPQCDQTFSCSVVPVGRGSVIVEAAGMIKDGQVVQLQTVLMADPEQYDQADPAAQKAMMHFSVFPVSIFRKDVVTYADFTAFVDTMSLVSAEGAPTEKRRIIDGDVEYTYMCGEREGKRISCFTVRYLPALSGGYFESGAQLPIIKIQ